MYYCISASDSEANVTSMRALELSLQYNFVTELTSLIVVADTNFTVGDQNGQNEHLEMDSLSSLNAGLPPPPGAPPARPALPAAPTPQPSRAPVPQSNGGNGQNVGSNPQARPLPSDSGDVEGFLGDDTFGGKSII